MTGGGSGHLGSHLEQYGRIILECLPANATKSDREADLVTIHSKTGEGRGEVCEASHSGEEPED